MGGVSPPLCQMVSFRFGLPHDWIVHWNFIGHNVLNHDFQPCIYMYIYMCIYSLTSHKSMCWKRSQLVAFFKYIYTYIYIVWYRSYHIDETYLRITILPMDIHPGWLSAKAHGHCCTGRFRFRRRRWPTAPRSLCEARGPTSARARWALVSVEMSGGFPAVNIEQLPFEDLMVFTTRPDGFFVARCFGI
jgi:hypothetical protein